MAVPEDRCGVHQGSRGPRLRNSLVESRPHRELGKLHRTAPDGAILQLELHAHRPWLSVNDRCRPMLRARPGHVRESEHGSGLAALALPRRQVRPVLGAAGLVGKGRWPAAAVRWDSIPGSDSSTGPGRGHEGPLTCRFSLPVVTTRARPGTRGHRCRRTQRGPSGVRSRLVVDSSGALFLPATSDLIVHAER
jgi:hypothetical protein